MNLLEAKKLQKKYGEQNVIQGIDLQINEGECTALLGPNGAGKTTIIKMLIGIVQPTSGEILLQGKSNQEMKHIVGYLPQHPTFYSWMTGKELLAFMGGLSEIPKPTLAKRIPELLELVGLSKDGHKPIGTYSGGMKQRLGIAQAIIHEPKFLIMDEPVSALDPQGRRDMLELLKVIKEKTTILFSTHILYDAEELCNKICILHQGKLLVSDSMDQLMIKHQQPVFIIKAPQNKEWLNIVSSGELVQEIEQAGNMTKVHVKDIDRGREWLLETIRQTNLPVQKFELVQENLEDIFLRMVKQA
ncbi:ABC transporter ATP-binding protein [Paenibacillus eucommiae]|uniref:ABC-2 type transport system ATP-binding protein n=1 Tax=Paenibacillus eucommiae TaxID=1355755 RepID=A0ABS4ITZ0_9BACL|nr:ABC transporter ATP-binding protein [Paenibacillus eucommiae]MBP1990044.1 ABC-2 type transport system ATP-binding protein [Paenibacillus eucommiae]